MCEGHKHRPGRPPPCRMLQTPPPDRSSSRAFSQTHWGSALGPALPPRHAAFLLICSFLCLETSVLSTPVLPVSRTVSSHNSHSETMCGHRNREQEMREPRSVASLVFSTLVHPGGREDPPGQHQTCFLPSCWIGLATILQAAFWQVHKAKSFKGRDGLCVLSLFFSYWFLCALPNPINKRPEERDARLAYKSLGLRLSFLFSIY